MLPRTLLALLALTLAAPHVAHADDQDAFAQDVKDYTGNYYGQFVMEKLTHFKVGAKCWKKFHDKDTNAQHTASFWVGYVLEYAKRATGDDWAAIETQGNTDREKNKPTVEKMVKDFGAKFSFTLVGEGDDCDTDQGSLMLRYWGTVGDALQYISGKTKVAITLTMSSKTKDIGVKISGGTIAITASKDVEPAAWDEKITKPIKRAKL
jgi:hypothetical protein